MCISTLEWEHILENHTPEIMAAVPGKLSDYDSAEEQLDAGWHGLTEDRRGVLADEAQAKIFPELHLNDLRYRLAQGLQGAQSLIDEHLAAHPELLSRLETQEDEDEDDEDTEELEGVEGFFVIAERHPFL